ncbi:hypothetical protein L1987_70704 [Smallanthus sonchifolius]|uniref:Uncharacterized protein n=1 Tax=Smallanthus sonchifolius TaxID=185202 RepID=A0ACB9AR89_9ASTR|nr:hypothetical protein L1987_70704 [Smallanthus sonchifolius]
MKKLYNNTRGRIHPSPPQPSSSATPNHRLPLLPLAITTLAAALAPEDQEVLVYLLSISATNTTKSSITGDHLPQFNCNCFRCYTSFWVRWDASPNRKMIHEIIDVYEDGLICKKKSGNNKKERKNNNKGFSSSGSSSIRFHAPATVASSATYAPTHVEQKNVEGEDGMGMGSLQKGSVRKIVNFVGERIWGVWGV